MPCVEAESFMRLIALTLPYFYKGEAADISKLLTERGFWRVHIRKPDSFELEMRRLIEEIPEELRHKISLHDHHELAIEYRLGGIHLNSRNPDVPYGWSGIVSRSIHSIEEIASVRREDYAFLSPIYPSISKPGYHVDFDFNELRNNVNNKIFALGGVTKSRIEEIAGIGFGGAAMLGAAWKAEINSEHFKLQFITHKTNRYDIVSGAMAALEGGCRWIQLRMKDGCADELIASGKIIADLCRRFGATFIVDDHVELVREIGADGVHLGKNDMPVVEARKLLGKTTIIGATANCFEDIKVAYNSGADYIGLGPFRFTTTKTNLSPILGLDGYNRIITECRAKKILIPVVAIGGITINDIRSIMNTGISGIALSGSILNADSPEIETLRILNEINNSIL